MAQAIIGIGFGGISGIGGIVGIGFALMIYLDRARRRESTELRGDMTGLRSDMTGLRQDMTAGFAALRQELNDRIESSARRTDNRIKEVNRSANRLNRSVIELARSVGRVEGRTETLAAVE